MSKGVIFALIGFGAYSLMNLNHKYSITALKIDLFTYFFYLTLVASLVLTMIGMVQNGFKAFFQIPKGVGKYILLRASLSSIGIPTSIFALSMLPMHIYSPIVLLAPIVVTLFSFFFLGERFSKEQILIIIFAFIGVIFITRPWQVSSFSHEYILGLSLSVFLIFIMASISIISRVGLSKIDATVATWYGAWFMFFSALMYHLLGFAPITHVSIKQLPYLAYGGIFYAIGLIFFTKGYGIGPIKKVAPTAYTQLMWGVLFDIIFFNSYATLLEILGILIIAGVNFLNLSRSN